MSWRNAVSGAGGRMSNAEVAAAMAAFENRRLRAGGVEPGTMWNAVLRGQMAAAAGGEGGGGGNMEMGGAGGAGGPHVAQAGHGIAMLAAQMAAGVPVAGQMAQAGQMAAAAPVAGNGTGGSGGRVAAAAAAALPEGYFAGLASPVAAPSARNLAGLPFFGAPLVPGGGAAAAARPATLLPGLNENENGGAVPELPALPPLPNGRPVAPNPMNARYAADPAAYPRDALAYRRAMVEWLMANDPTNPNLAQLQRDLAMMETSGMMFGFGLGGGRRRRRHRKSRKSSRKHRKTSRKNRK